MANLPDPSTHNANGWKYLRPVAKLPSVPEHRNAPEPLSNGVLRKMFPPLFHAGRDPRVG